jgi:uncharacterized protein (TIGR00369 family)
MTPSVAPSDASLDPKFRQYLRTLFEEQIVFNRLLGLKMLDAGPDWFSCSMDMRADHGGVISAVLDVIAGMACIAALGNRHSDKPIEQRMAHFDKLGTIDLRVDYLRPAVSERFEAKARVTRLGSRLANTQMEFFSDSGQLLATGSAAYIIS